MWIIELLPVTYAILFALYEWVAGRRLKTRLTSHHINKRTIYWQSIAFLWLGVLLTGLYVMAGFANWRDLGVPVTWQLSYLAEIAVILLAGAALYYQHVRSLRSAAARQSLKKMFTPYKWFLPENKREQRLFIYGVSVSAGVCEELLFRGFLLYYLSPLTGTPGAVIISSALFGLCHAYQGNIYIVRTAVLGIGLCLLYLLTDSLILVTGLHILIDVSSGHLAYQVLSFPAGANARRHLRKPGQIS